MAMPDLLEALRSEAEARAEDDLEAARAEAKRIVEGAKARVAAIRAARMRAIESEVRAEDDTSLARERTAARIAVLHARHAMLERVMAAVRARFPDAAIAAPPEVLARHLSDAMRYLPEGLAKVRCRLELEPLVTPLARAHGLSLETVTAGGWGIALVVASGRMEVDNTLEARLERLRPALAVELVRLAEEGIDGRLG